MALVAARALTLHSTIGLSFLAGFGDGNKKIRQINFQIAAIGTTAFRINVDNRLKWL